MKNGLFKNWKIGLTRPYLPYVLALLAMLLAIPSLWTGLVLDDFYMKAVVRGGTPLGETSKPLLHLYTYLDGNPLRTEKLVDKGLMPWWTQKNAILNFFRPIPALTHGLDYLLWPDSPMRMHVHSLLWFGAMILLVSFFYRRFIPLPWIAGLAALLYAVDDAHAIAVGWLANRNALVALVFGVASLLFHDRWRKEKHTLSGLAALFFFSLGLLSQEAAVAICGYLFSYALFIDPEKSKKKKILSFTPYAIVVLVWLVFYKVNHYGVRGMESYVDPIVSPHLFLGKWIFRAPVLLLGQWGLPPSGIFEFVPQIGKTVILIWALGFLSVLFYFFIVQLRRDHLARFWFLGMMLALIPACATMLSDRQLLFVGLGAMGLLSQFFHSVWTHSNSRTSPFQTSLIRKFSYILMVVHLILSPLLLPLKIGAFTLSNRVFIRYIEDTPLGDAAAEKTVVIVNAPTFYSLYLPIIRAFHGQSSPAYIRDLAANLGFTIPIRLSRPDLYTLTAQPEGGFLWFLFRDRSQPLPVGSRIELPGMTVEVTKSTKKGIPTEVSYRFSKPLEDSSLVWLQIQNRTPTPFTPPAVGEVFVLGKGWRTWIHFLNGNQGVKRQKMH